MKMTINDNEAGERIGLGLRGHFESANNRQNEGWGFLGGLFVNFHIICYRNYSWNIIDLFLHH